MARKCKIVRDDSIKQCADRAKAARNELKNNIKQADSYDDIIAAVNKLNKKPKRECLCRWRRRCRICGRSRGVYRRFGLCRLCLRKAFIFGLIPGVRKASW